MKTYEDLSQEGWFDKKSKEDPDEKELYDLGMKAAGRGGWSKREQERYNDLWMKLHKKGKTPTSTPPSVYGDDSWGTKTAKLHKKLRLTKRDHEGVLEGYQEVQNLANLIQDEAEGLIKAAKKGDMRAVAGFYKQIGKLLA